MMKKLACLLLLTFVVSAFTPSVEAAVKSKPVAVKAVKKGKKHHKKHRKGKAKRHKKNA